LECWSNASTPNLEDQGISLRLTLTLILSGKGDPTSSYATAGTALGIVEVCKPIHPVKIPSSVWRCLRLGDVQIIPVFHNRWW